MGSTADILTTEIDSHRPGGVLDDAGMRALLVQYALIFDRVLVPDAQAMTNPVFRGLATEGEGRRAGTIHGLLRAGVLAPTRRNSMDSFADLRVEQLARGIQNVPDEAYVAHLNRLTKRSVVPYDPGEVARVFRERSLGGLREIPPGGGVDATVTARLIDHLEQTATYGHVDVRAWLAQNGALPGSPTYEAVDLVMARSYQGNVARELECNFDIANPLRTAAVTVVSDQVEIPPSALALVDPLVLTALDTRTIKDVRRSDAFRDLSAELERLRTSAPASASVDTLATCLDKLGFVMTKAAVDHLPGAAGDRLRELKRRQRFRATVQTVTTDGGLGAIGVAIDVAGAPIGVAGLFTLVTVLGATIRTMRDRHASSTAIDAEIHALTPPTGATASGLVLSRFH